MRWYGEDEGRGSHWQYSNRIQVGLESQKVASAQHDSSRENYPEKKHIGELVSRLERVEVKRPGFTCSGKEFSTAQGLLRLNTAQVIGLFPQQLICLPPTWLSR